MIRKVNCKECGGDVFTPDLDYEAPGDNPPPIWECNNCHNVTPRQTRKSAKSKALDAWFNEV